MALASWPIAVNVTTGELTYSTALPSGSAGGPGTGVITAMLRGKSSMVIQAVGDSTTVGSNAWFAKMGLFLGAQFPDYTILHRSWSEGGADYVQPTVLQAGTGNGGGDRAFRYTAAHPFTHIVGTAVTGDIDVRVKVALDDWTSGATQILVGQWTTDGNLRGWAFRVTSTGNLSFIGSVDGAATTTTHTSSAAVSYGDGEAGWVRCTHDVDNGAAGRTTTFYTSTDGDTWSALGTAQTTAGTTTLFATTVPLQLGVSHISSIYQNRGVGDYYWVEVRRGIGGPSVCPPLIDKWEFVESDTTTGYSWLGAPVVLLVNGGIAGGRISDWSDVSIKDKLHADHGTDLFLLNDGHNEGRPTQGIFLQDLETYILLVQAYLPDVPIGVLGQNPVDPSDYSDNAVTKRAMRVQSIARWAATRQGVEFVDSAGTWTDYPTQLSEDGLHPSAAGYLAWGEAVYDALFGGLLRASS